jgi:hypothetical protein
MISASTDDVGFRTYQASRALVDVATAIYSGMDQRGALFALAGVLSWADCATAENIALRTGHQEAVEFVQTRIERLAPANRRAH